MLIRIKPGKLFGQLYGMEYFVYKVEVTGKQVGLVGSADGKCVFFE